MAKKEIKKSNPYLVVQDNEFINFRHTLSVQEARVFLSMIAKVERGDEDFKEYEIDVQQFIQDSGLKRKDIYTELKRVSHDLRQKTFRKEQEDGSFLITGYVSSAEYIAGEGVVKLSFDPKLKPYLLQLKSKFTQYDIRNIIALRSIFSVLLYQLLKQFETIGERTFDLIDLKYKLNVDDKYKQYNDFKRYALEIAEKEIKENCDIYFRFEEIKKGRKVQSIKFYIYPQTPPREKTKAIEQKPSQPQGVEDIEFEEIQESTKQTPSQTTTPSVPSMAMVQELADKLKLNLEQVNILLDNYGHNTTVMWEALNAITNAQGIKNVMAYALGSTGLGAGTWGEQQETKQKQTVKKRQENQSQKIDHIKKEFLEYERKRIFEVIKKLSDDERDNIFDTFLSVEQNKRNRAWYTEEKGISPYGEIEAMKQYLINNKGYNRTNELISYASKAFDTEIKFDKNGQPFIQEWLFEVGQDTLPPMVEAEPPTETTTLLQVEEKGAEPVPIEKNPITKIENLEPTEELEQAEVNKSIGVNFKSWLSNKLK